MSIKKVISIQNAGRIKNYSASGDVEFKKFNLIYGENGRGKTTFCAILRSLQDGNASHITGRKTLGVVGVPSVHIQLDSAHANFANLAWSQTLPNLMIFDQDFISQNVYSGNNVGAGQRRNLYKIIIGTQGVTLANQYEQKKTDITALTSRIRGITQTIQSHLSSGLTVTTFLSAQRNPNIDVLIETANRELTAGNEASIIRTQKQLNILSILAIPENLESILNTTLESISADVERKIRQHISDHGMSKEGQGWLSQGLAFNIETECPFCGQDVTQNDLITAYQQFFGKSYNELKEDIISQGKGFSERFGDTQIQEIISLIQENISINQFWKRYCEYDDLPDLDVDVVRASIAEIKESVLQLLRAKASNPLEIVATDERFHRALESFQVTIKALEAYNGNGARSNEIIQNRKQSVQNVNLQTLQDNHNRFVILKRRFEDPLEGFCNSAIALQNEKTILEAERDQIKSQLDAYSQQTFGQYQTLINKYLDKFNAGFSISNVDHNYVGGANAQYQILINDNAIKLGDDNTPLDQPSFRNTLSSGDKSTLALAFFLAQVENDPQKSQKVLVFDDPFNSQDSFRRNQTAIEIFRLGKDCAQTIVLSHDAYFLKQVGDKIHDATVKCLQFVPKGNDNSDLVCLDLDKLLKPELRALADKLQIYFTDSTGDPNDVVQKIRPLLEGYCRNLCFTRFRDDHMLSQILTDIRNEGNTHPLNYMYQELSDLNDYTSRHHHADGSVTHILNQGELSAHVKRALKLVGAL